MGDLIPLCTAKDFELPIYPGTEHTANHQVHVAFLELINCHSRGHYFLSGQPSNIADINIKIL